MFCNFGKQLFCKFLVNASSSRCMTSTEVSTALRPFYFAVHPDLFGQHPSQRATNENSLKQLSSFLETLQNRSLFESCDLQFYMRHKNEKDKFRLVKIQLRKKDIRESVLTILKSCELPTDYVDKIEKPIPQAESSDKGIDLGNWSQDDPIFGPVVLTRKIEKFKDAFALKKWIEDNYQNALDKAALYKPVRDEISKLQKSLVSKWGLCDIQWDCDWNEMQFRGCLKNLEVLSQQHPGSMMALRGRILVFSSFTGVSLDGHIMLFNGEVRHNWLDLIKNIKKYDSVLLRIPAFEKSVSQVLRNINVVRRKFMPKIKAAEYEKHLLQLTTSLGDYLGRRNFPEAWPESLETYELVVESEAGPLMVSPTGQFIVPASCPGFLLVSFITDNLENAKGKMEIYNRNKHIERSLHKECVRQLELADLRKDDNVNPDVMIECCQKLLLHKSDLTHLKGVHLNIATYYSVLADGAVCIPWNWKLK